MSFLNKSVSASMFLQPASVSELDNAIMSLNNYKSLGYDNIRAHFLRSAANYFVFPLSILVNFSFELGCFPNCLKTAKVIPLYKSGDKTLATNYRPISLLTCFSKILEKLIFTRLTNFFDQNSVISTTQYGFRKSHSTSHAVLDVVTTSYDNINDNKYTGLVLLDLKKAFDTVTHQILSNKLKHYGIRGKAYDLLSSYLEGRKQFVSNTNTVSTTQPVDYGVPQRSTLGPLLFLVYINDIVNSTSSTPRLFADDTCLIVNSDSLSNLKSTIKLEIIRILKWVNANKLTVNPSKYNIIIVPPKINQSVDDSIIDTTPVAIVSEAKYLGIIIDNTLTFNPHIAHLEVRLSRSVGILSKLKYFLPSPLLSKLYYAFFHSYLLYGLIIWFNTYKTYTNKITALQTKAVKLISNSKRTDKCSPIYALQI